MTITQIAIMIDPWIGRKNLSCRQNTPQGATSLVTLFWVFFSTFHTRIFWGERGDSPFLAKHNKVCTWYSLTRWGGEGGGGVLLVPLLGRPLLGCFLVVFGDLLGVSYNVFISLILYSFHSSYLNLSVTLRGYTHNIYKWQTCRCGFRPGTARYFK